MTTISPSILSADFSKLGNPPPCFSRKRRKLRPHPFFCNAKSSQTAPLGSSLTAVIQSTGFMLAGSSTAPG